MLRWRSCFSLWLGSIGDFWLHFPAGELAPQLRTVRLLHGGRVEILHRCGRGNALYTGGLIPSVHGTLREVGFIHGRLKGSRNRRLCVPQKGRLDIVNRSLCVLTCANETALCLLNPGEVVDAIEEFSEASGSIVDPRRPGNAGDLVVIAHCDEEPHQFRRVQSLAFWKHPQNSRADGVMVRMHFGPDTSLSLLVADRFTYVVRECSEGWQRVVSVERVRRLGPIQKLEHLCPCLVVVPRVSPFRAMTVHHQNHVLRVVDKTGSPVALRMERCWHGPICLEELGTGRHDRSMVGVRRPISVPPSPQLRVPPHCHVADPRALDTQLLSRRSRSGR